MTHILKNKNLEIHIDTPLENYRFSRFDWTGKIVKVIFQDIEVSGVESNDYQNEDYLGKGFYNEFGIDTALGFDEAEIGGWFHKIGVGLLKKEGTPYQFTKAYEIKPAEFKITTTADRILISCISDVVNGYSYVLKKEIAIHDSGFTINYFLENTGQKEIVTNEYTHNFTAINKDSIGSDYVLKFPFQLQSKRFGETVNPELKIDIGSDQITCNSALEEEFFFSNLSGSEKVSAAWELTNLKSNIRISETGSFQTNKVNLWGLKHVISPELFFDIAIKPGKSTVWSRTYNVRKT